MKKILLDISVPITLTVFQKQFLSIFIPLMDVPKDLLIN